MEKCKICGKDVSDIHSLSCHIARTKDHPGLKDYYDKEFKKEGEGICKTCGKETRFDNMVKGYKNYCSISCVNKSEEHVNKIRENNEKKYGPGIKNVFQLESIKEKSKKTMVEKFGVEHNSYSESTIKKRKQKYASKSEEEKQKIKQKIKQTNLERYGVENIQSLPETREKIKQTNLERYGVETPFESKEIQNKIQEKYKVTIFNRLTSSDRLKGLCSPLFNIDEYDVVRDARKYKWKCSLCGHEFIDSIDDGRVPRCKKCFPAIPHNSEGEVRLFEFIKDLCEDAVSTEWELLDNKLEVDIYIPSLSVAIEYDGLYWHSEPKRDKFYHLKKTELCASKGVKLFHIFEDEWNNKEEIVKSILSNKLGKTSITKMARKCKIVNVSSEDSDRFLEENHIQGPVNSSIRIGLVDENEELSAVLTAGKHRFSPSGGIEIYRFCNKLNTTVVGGFSKLLHHLRREVVSDIITYVDLRYSTGDSYLKNGFELIGTTGPNYYYLSPGVKERFSRMKFQKKNLKSILKEFDENLTEWENMQINGYTRIWDCGNLIMHLKAE